MIAGCVVGGEEGERGRDLLRLHKPLHRHALEDRCRYSIIFGPTARSVMSVCVNPGLTAFDADPVLRELERHRAVEAEQARLGGVVARERAVAAACRRSRCCAGSRRRPFRHRARDALRHEERRRSGSWRRPRSSRLLHLEERRLVVDAGVVDRGRRSRSQRSSAAATAPSTSSATDTSATCTRARAPHRATVSSSGSRVRPSTSVGALGGEALGDRAADSAPGAGDDDALALEAGHQPLTAPAVRPRMKKRWPKR